MPENDQKLALVGLPESGKTTFVAALYHIIQQPELNPALVLTRLPNQTKYLDGIVKSWRDLEPMIHTIDGTFEPIIFSLRDKETRNRFDLLFPDVSGEDFDDQWESRQCQKQYKELIEEVRGVLLFIHPSVVAPVTIAERDKVLGKKTPNDVPDANQPYNAKSAPTGIKLVELVQVIKSFVPKGKSIRIAVVVSAWDVGEKKSNRRYLYKPQEWLEAKLPVLHQFLTTNDDWICYEVFGVSAQGGNYEKDTQKLKELGANAKVRVVSSQGTSSDITLPIRWAIGD